MTKLGISKQKRVWLASQLDEWRSRGLISEEQSGPILDLYETPADLAERSHSKIMTTLMSVAAAMIGFGALLLLGYNWSAMPGFLKLLIIFGMVTGTHVAAFKLRYRQGSKVLSEIAFFLACVAYGIGIFLIAQIFNVNAHYPDGIWWWAIGVLPFAFLLDTLLLQVLLVCLLGIWCGMEIIGFGNAGLWFLWRWGALPNLAISLPFLAVPGLVWAYRKDSVAAVALYIALLSWWVILQPIAWQLGDQTAYIIGILGALMLVIGEAHQTRRRYSIPYRFLGALLTGGALLAMSFFGFNETMLDLNSKSGGMNLALIVLGFFALAVYLILRQNPRSAVSEASYLNQVMRQVWLPMCLFGVMVGLMLWQLLIHEPLVPTIVSNLAMIALAIWLMNVGLRDDRGRPFAGGVFCLLLWAVVRYVDLFGDFGGMLGAALMFFLCGAALFGVAYYWRNRKGDQNDKSDR